MEAKFEFNLFHSFFIHSHDLKTFFFELTIVKFNHLMFQMKIQVKKRQIYIQFSNLIKIFIRLKTNLILSI